LDRAGTTIVYADIEGNVGYTFAGKIPIRTKSNGRLPVPGWTDEFEWLGYIPHDQLPHIMNPEQGYIATANNRVVKPDYPINIELEPISGDRAQRIAEMILDASLRSGEEKIGVEFCQQMHFDPPPIGSGDLATPGPITTRSVGS
jgi:penicillin amidase